MAKKRAKKVGGVDLTGFHFNSPTLQKAYNQWFVNSPMRAPVTVEWEDYVPTDEEKERAEWLEDQHERVAGRPSRAEIMSGGPSRTSYTYVTGKNGGNFVTGSPAHRTALREGREDRGESFGGAGLGAVAGNVYGGKETKELMQGRDSTNARIQALGGKPVGQDSGNSVWNRVIDVMLRGNYAVAEGIRQADKDASQNDASFLSQIKSFASGAKAGATGKKKTTFGKVLDEKDVSGSVESFFDKISGDSKWGKRQAKTMGNIVEGTAALGLDIGLDPTTYAGVGLVTKPAQALRASTKAAEHIAQGSKVTARGRKTPFTFDELTQELVTGGRHVKGKVKHSEEALVYQPLRAMRNSIEKTRFTEIRNELRLTDDWARIFDRGGAKNAASLAAANKTLNATAREIAVKEAEDWLVTAVKNYQDTVATRIQHGIGIGMAGTHGKKVTVVPAPLVNVISKRVKDVDVVQKGLMASQKYLMASAGVTPDLHNLRLQATNAGMTRAEHMGNRLRGAFNGMHRDISESTWEAGLNRNTHSGERITVDGIEQDAAEFFNKEVDVLDQNARGISTGNTPMGAKELNAMLPPGFRGKFKNENGMVNVRESLKQWQLKEGPRALWIAQQAYERANTMRSMYVSAADSFGMRTTGDGALKNASVIFSDLKNRGWREVSDKKTHGLLKGVLFDDETARGMEKMIDLMNNERNWNTFMRKLSRITSPIKFYLTVPNPGYHIRNSIGDAFINEIDNVGMQSYYQSAAVLRNVSEKYGGVKPLIMEEGNLLEKAYARPDQKVVFHTKNALRKPNGTKATHVTEAEIYAGMNQYGITQNFTLSEFANISDNPNVMNAMGGKVKSWMINKSEMRENYFRLAHFIDLVKKNPNNALTLDENMAYAAARIRKTHFDYTDFTRWEKQVASNVIPFYKWTRKAVPLMMEIMFTNPGKAIVPTKAQYALSQMAGYDPGNDDPFPQLAGMIPQWMIDAGYSPGNTAAGMFGQEGPGMFALSNPFTDTFTQTINPIAEGVRSGSPKRLLNTVLQQSNPALKVPYELVQNENTFLSREENVPVFREGTKKKDIGNYLLNQVPYARQANRAFAGEKDKRNFGALASQLGGIYSQELTPSIVRGELYRQEQEASDKWTALKEKVTKKLNSQGIRPPETTAEWDKFLEAYAAAYGLKYKGGR